MSGPADSKRPAGGSGSPAFEDDGRAVYALRYYVHLFTRRRRPFFSDVSARRRCEELLRATAAGLGCVLARCEVGPSRVVLEVEAPPTLAPQVLVTRLREDVAGPLKAEFEEIRRAGAVFVRRYVVATAPVPESEWVALEAGISRW